MKRACLSLMMVVLTAAAAFAAERKPVVQLALLLDTSNSMDGLIAQAKSQLWRIVNEFAVAEHNGQRAELQVALMEYGNDNLPAKEGHIRLVVPLTTDLDLVSQELFALKTRGGQEYCGWVIKDAVERLVWSKAPADLKGVFIAGNEPFTQGQTGYRESCKAAVQAGITVNTIHCGSEADGIGGRWRDGAVLGEGQFMNIDHNKAIRHIPAPQDPLIAELDAKLNATYVPYGALGEQGRARQVQQDANARSLSQGVYSGRANFKITGNYRNAAWDLVDAVEEGKVKVEDLKEEALPETLRTMTIEGRKGYVQQQATARKELKAQVGKLYAEREKFVAAEQAKLAAGGAKTLDDAVLGAVRDQAARKQFRLR